MNDKITGSADDNRMQTRGGGYFGGPRAGGIFSRKVGISYSKLRAYLLYNDNDKNT